MTLKQNIEAEEKRIEDVVGYLTDHYPNAFNEINKSLTRIHNLTLDSIEGEMGEEKNLEWKPTKEKPIPLNEGDKDRMIGYNVCRKETLDIIDKLRI